MPIMIRSNVERNVPAEAVEKFKAAGYKILSETKEPAKTSQEGTETALGEEKEAEMSTREGQDAGSEVKKNAEEINTEDAAGQGAWKDLPDAEKKAALEGKKVDELRKIAKSEGIQGYGNMSKDTLVEIIMNH